MQCPTGRPSETTGKRPIFKINEGGSVSPLACFILQEILSMTIDFRSDTVTKPTPGMLKAMMTAKVGDDVFGEDPSINELEKMSAEMFGMESGLFCPSGTMTNQIAIKCHTQPGDEVICDESAHVYQYEGGGIASNSARVVVRSVAVAVFIGFPSSGGTEGEGGRDSLYIKAGCPTPAGQVGTGGNLSRLVPACPG